MKPLVASLSFLAACVGLAAGCAPIEYSVVIVDAATLVAEAEAAGAACSEEQLVALSPSNVTTAPDPGTAIVSTNEAAAVPQMGEPLCAAPYEYYAALEYLHKAREEVGYSDYEPAIAFAREARALARKARDIAQNRRAERGRQR